jgi:hypothetical protein
MFSLKQMAATMALIAFIAAAAYAQVPDATQQRTGPDFRVQIWGDVVSDFENRVSAYAELRGKLEKGLPPMRVTENPAEIRRAVRALARRIQAARANARQGDIFSPSISNVFRKALRLEANAGTCAAIMDDNPGGFSHRITGSYPKDKPLSTMPPNLLAALPDLPPDVEYRFAGRHLILLDVRASVILDRIPHALPCAD